MTTVESLTIVFFQTIIWKKRRIDCVVCWSQSSVLSFITLYIVHVLLPMFLILLWIH